MGHASGGYYIPSSSHWPAVGSAALFLTMFGAGNWLNGTGWGVYIFFAGIAVLLYMMFGWFGDVIRESESGTYSAPEDMSFRLGMSWFIFSEVMFFAAFFGALYYVRQFAVPWLGGEGDGFFTNLINWSGYEASWPTNGPGAVGGAFEPMAALGLPAINTAILLTSGITVTIAHHALRKGNRQLLALGLLATVVLGFTFVGLQAFEYHHAYTEMNLTLGAGIYGSTFFMLTGFHGMHVTIGAIMLTVILFRSLAGHFKPDQHFAFEAVAWYWHFVDVVWLGLYFFVYWL
jgi:cytochrome c oxidase subunit III